MEARVVEWWRYERKLCLWAELELASEFDSLMRFCSVDHECFGLVRLRRDGGPVYTLAFSCLSGR